VLAVTGIINKSLGALTTGLLGGTSYTMNQASYDLARLRTDGLIIRVPAKNRYRLAISYTKLHDRLLRPLLAARQPRFTGGPWSFGSVRFLVWFLRFRFPFVVWHQRSRLTTSVWVCVGREVLPS
jgi:hypothetical protein